MWGRTFFWALATALAANSFNPAKAAETRCIETVVENPLIEDMKSSVYKYYYDVSSGLEGKLSHNLKADFIKKANRHGIEAKTWAELQEYFENKNYYLYAENKSDEYGLHVNVLLSELVSKKKSLANVGEKEFEYKTVLIKNPTIQGFTYFDSKKNQKTAHANPSITHGRTIIHNLDVYRSSASMTWEYLKKESSPFGEFDYNIRNAEWRTAYNLCNEDKAQFIKKLIRQGLIELKDLKKLKKLSSRELFIEGLVLQRIKEAEIHELYHMSVRGTKHNTNDRNEEKKARYFTDANTPLSQGSFLRDAYALFHLPENSEEHKVSKERFEEIIQYIKGNKENFPNIEIKGNDIKEQVLNLYLLKKTDNVKIAKHLFLNRL